MRHYALLVWLACPVLLAFAGAQERADDASKLTLKRVFGSSEFEPEGYSATWLEDASGYLTLEKSSDTEGGRDIVRHRPATGETTILVPASNLIPPGASAPLKMEGYAFSEDRSLVLVYTNSKRVWRRNTRGDYWLLDRASRELRQLGGDARPATLMFAKIAPDGRHVAYVRERNIYVEDLQSHAIRCLTETENDDIINGTFDWVYEEEFGLRDGFRWSPDGRSIAYWRMNTQGVRRFPLVSNTHGLYPRITHIPYPKTGQKNPAYSMGVVDVDSGNTRWVDVPGDPRDHYLARMGWADQPGLLILQQLNRLQNTNRVMVANPQDASTEVILTEHDDAWVDVHDELMWLDNGRRFTWISERDGWRHAYLATQTSPARLVTPGDFDVIRLLHIDEASGWLYFIASPDNPTQRYLYRARVDGSGHERITPEDQPGSHTYQISPDAQWAIHTHSTFDSPPVTDLVRLPSHERVRSLAENKTLREKIAQLARAPAEFFRVDIGDGTSLDGWCIQPPGLDPKKKYPLLVYVYGEPAGQTVRDRWGGQNYLWHLLLAQRGYVIISVDNRGTPAPRGRAWRKCVYRKVGIIAPQDQAAAVKELLRQRPYLDADRVGVWGWSGGGSMSLNAVFKYPELYDTAIAIAPVPNQRYYDTIYQERYMGLPKDNVDGYVDGSPVHFAHQLQGNLLLIHGTGDDNCHYQTSELLINELIRHNKRFTMMAYPNRSHSIREGKNTTRHLRELMTWYLQENLPPGPE